MFKEKIINETEWKLGEDANSMQNEMAHCITSVAKEVLGESRGNRLTEQKETFYLSIIYINMMSHDLAWSTQS